MLSDRIGVWEEPLYIGGNTSFGVHWMSPIEYLFWSVRFLDISNEEMMLCL